MIRPYPAVSFCLLLLGSSAPVFAQPVLDRVVGPTPWNQPLTLTQLNGQNIGGLALAARVPMGLESDQRPFRANWSIPATGRTLRDVLDALVAAEPGYSWEEMDGVVLIRPVERASGDRDVLSIQIERFQLRDVRSADAMNALATLFGAGGVAGPGDTRRFSVDMPDGSTIREVLNAIVRAHGTLAWACEHKSRVGPGEVPTSIGLAIGYTFTTVGIKRDARIGQVPPAPADVVAADVDTSPILDRIVGSDRQGRPVSVSVLNAPNVAALADASRTPMGVETTGSIRERVPIPQPTIVTGMRLADALATLAAMDGRYEWREMDGVIVFRPREAWGDGQDPLFLPVRDVQLRRVTLSTVLGLIASALKSRDHATTYGPSDTRRISIDIPAGSVLDLLNAAAKAHGQLTWQFDELSRGDQRTSGGRRHMVAVTIFGSSGSYGLIVP